jgi:hypothetical protein
VKQPAPSRAWREPWTLAAWALLLAEVAAVLYLGARPGGRGPVLVYYLGPLVLGAGALVVAALGLVTASRRRPFAQPARVLAFSALALVVGTASYPLPFPAAREERPSRIELAFPLHGEWTVEWGGPDTARNLLARSRPDRRFGYDLVLEVEGLRHSGDEARLESWYAFGQPVSAPAPGTVVRIVEGLLDLAPGASGSGADELGNHVVLEIAPGEYLFLANLQRGSIAVEAGQRVEPDTLVGRVGCSGNQRFTRGPHLALHLQDEAEARWGQGIPFSFHDVLVDGVRSDRAQPCGRSLTGAGATRGQRVRRAP